MLLRKIAVLAASGAMVVTLSACDFEATGSVECHTNDEGQYVCTGESVSTPEQAGPPPTEEPMDPPAPEPEPEPQPEPEPEPSPGDGVTAAETLGWGEPVAAGSDEFNYEGIPDPGKWNPYGGDGCWEGHNGNGQRCAERNYVNGEALVQSGLANGDSAGLSADFGQQYGRWEARIKTEALAEDNGRTYHPLLIIWPDSNEWPIHGEYDFFENFAPEAQSIQSYIHYPHNRDVEVQQEHAQLDGVDTGEWQNLAIEWTPDPVKGFINGEEWYSWSDGAIDGVRGPIQAMPSGHLTIQLDNFHGDSMQPANYYVDWVRTYTLN